VSRPRALYSVDYMDGRSTEEIREELEELMREQIASLKAETFGGLTEKELREQQERLKRIRELSADFLSAVKKNRGMDRQRESA
jgi:hypothetical protein